MKKRPSIVIGIVADDGTQTVEPYEKYGPVTERLVRADKNHHKEVDLLPFLMAWATDIKFGYRPTDAELRRVAGFILAAGGQQLKGWRAARAQRTEREQSRDRRIRAEAAKLRERDELSDRAISRQLYKRFNLSRERIRKIIRRR
jgi:hypothetical protein